MTDINLNKNCFINILTECFHSSLVKLSLDLKLGIIVELTWVKMLK
jgi:hypothetical protein